MVEVELLAGAGGSTLNFPSLSSRKSIASYGSVVSVNTYFRYLSSIKKNTEAENDFVLWPCCPLTVISCDTSFSDIDPSVLSVLSVYIFI